MLLKDAEKLGLFVEKIENFSSLPDKEVVDHFSFFIMTTLKASRIQVFQLEDCFDALNLRPYSRIAAYLSEESTKKKVGKYVRPKTGGYVLERSAFKKIEEKIEKSPQRKVVTRSLESLVSRIKDFREASFLQEALNCLSVGSNRAAIVMVWSLAMYHMQNYILARKLKNFNQELAKSSLKIKAIKSYDDFSELKEIKVLELMRASKAITNDVWKILDIKLGIRNTAGHPSNVVIGESKTDDFISDLVENVVLKY